MSTEYQSEAENRFSNLIYLICIFPIAMFISVLNPPELNFNLIQFGLSMLLITVLELFPLRLLWQNRRDRKLTVIDLIINVGIVPFTEEIIFRHGIQRGLANYINVWLAIVFTAFLFSFIHLFTIKKRRNRWVIKVVKPLGILGYYNLFAILFGMVYYTSGNAFLNVLFIHAWANALDYFIAIWKISRRRRISFFQAL